MILVNYVSGRLIFNGQGEITASVSRHQHFIRGRRIAANDESRTRLRLPNA